MTLEQLLTAIDHSIKHAQVELSATNVTLDTIPLDGYTPEQQDRVMSALHDRRDTLIRRGKRLRSAVGVLLQHIEESAINEKKNPVQRRQMSGCTAACNDCGVVIPTIEGMDYYNPSDRERNRPDFICRDCCTVRDTIRRA